MILAYVSVKLVEMFQKAKSKNMSLNPHDSISVTGCILDL